MAGVDIMFNIARGTAKYYYYAVENSLVLASAGQFTSTANAAFVVVLLEASGLESDATLRDYDDLAALLAAANNEQVNQSRKVLTDSDLAAVPSPDDANERYDLDLPDQLYTALGGNIIGKALVCFRPDTGSADSAIIPLWGHDVDITPDGNNVTLQIAATGAYRSSGG
jgi:hypothetical protein